MWMDVKKSAEQLLHKTFLLFLACWEAAVTADVNVYVNGVRFLFNPV